MCYYLDIHHRNTTVLKNGNDSFVTNSLPSGHTFISLGDSDSDVEEFFGWYPKRNDFFCSTEFGLEDEIEMCELLKELSRKNQDYLFKKRIFLSFEQYNKALHFSKSLLKNFELHSGVLNFDGSINFIQSVYNAAKLPLHFTHVYSYEELLKLPYLTHYQQSESFNANYGSRAELLIGILNISGFNKEEIVARLNVPIKRIKQSININLNDSPAVTLLPNFKVKLEKSDFLPKHLVLTITNSQIQSTQLEVLFNNKEYFISQFSEQSKTVTKNLAENEKKLKQFILKVNLSIKEYHEKLEKIIKSSTINLNNLDFTKEIERSGSKTLSRKELSETSQIEATYKCRVNSLISQKQIELHADIQASTVDSSLEMIPIVDIVEKKQAELDFALEKCKTEYESEFEDVKNKYFLKKLKESFKNVEFIAFMLILKNESFLKKLKFQVEQVNDKLSQGEYIDIESTCNFIGVQISAHLYDILKVYNMTLNELNRYEIV